MCNFIAALHRFFPTWKTIESHPINFTINSQATGNLVVPAVAVIQCNQFGEERGWIECPQLTHHCSPEYIRARIAKLS